MSSEKINIGDLLKEIRLNNKLTQDEFSKKLNIPRSTYANYENNNREPSIETINLISKEFKVDIFKFLNVSNYTAVCNEDGAEVSNPYDRLRKAYNAYIEAFLTVCAMKGNPIPFLSPKDIEILMNASYSIHHSLIETIEQVSPMQDRMIKYMSLESNKNNLNKD